MKLLHPELIFQAMIIIATSMAIIMATPIMQDTDNSIQLDTNSLKSILLYNRLQQLVESEPEMLDLFDLDHGQITRIIDELLLQKSQQMRARKFLNVKSNKRAAAMGVDLPDYILHINKGKNFDFSSFREKMQKSG